MISLVGLERDAFFLFYGESIMDTKTLTVSQSEPIVGALPIRFIQSEQAAELTAMLNLTPDELLDVSGGLRRAGCCTPDGGTCCVNKGG